MRRWSQVETGKRMGYSNTLISYLERGQRSPTRPFAVKADEVFGTGDLFLELWRRYTRAAQLEGFAEFADAEARCRRLRALALTVVTGLFQVPDYAWALALAAVERGAITRAAAEQRVEFLLTRQQLLLQKSPPIVHAVLDESCLARPIGGPVVMGKQFDHLAELAARPNITIQVAPFSLAENLPFTLPVILLDLPDGTVIGYAESQTQGHLERRRQTVAGWEREYDQLLVEALPKAPSLALIRKARRELAP
ncbi:helix-turn-helix domain-containing protein [Kitasatospora acidiphila]|uniref:helix-turn-helix domain-containing protein n=1 Tax=Kitasatospora acidiphila TaxID=2567942 RepID=UPI002B4000BA|nr:helix-turn-helix transcriptional regulator [Kitasatospora acidiphila]